ncbi:hypothetical protein AVEN_231582-1 [Araneus ventricosus]|uniref:Uncharacterized protein n=1 Tax=Araneus ventricosus TaxID=182803 RepID=A0A4Y2ILC3_ARAVE|nr:hypothetical protein AVEN_231582-1 [Araneus ventricosus]
MFHPNIIKECVTRTRRLTFVKLKDGTFPEQPPHRSLPHQRRNPQQSTQPTTEHRRTLHRKSMVDTCTCGSAVEYTFLNVTHEQFRELCNVGESISQLTQKRLLGPLFSKAIREVLIVANSDDICLDGDEADIQVSLKNNLIKVLNKHIRHKLETLKIMCEDCSSDDNQSEHTCFEARLRYMDRCIASMDIHNLAHDFVNDNSQLYPYISDSFIENLNALELFEMCKFYLSVNL